MRGNWRPNTTATYWPPHSYGHQRFFPVLQGCSTGGLGAQLSDECWLSLPHLVSKTKWLPVFTELYNSSIAHSIFPHNWPSEYALPPSLEWRVWSSSNGNNCHAVHGSLSSSASVCDCNVGFLTLSHIVSQARPRQWNMHFRRLWNGMFGGVGGQYTTICH